MVDLYTAFQNLRDPQGSSEKHSAILMRKLLCLIWYTKLSLVYWLSNCPKIWHVIIWEQRSLIFSIKFEPHCFLSIPEPYSSPYKKNLKLQQFFCVEKTNKQTSYIIQMQNQWVKHICLLYFHNLFHLRIQHSESSCQRIREGWFKHVTSSDMNRTIALWKQLLI